MKLIDKFVPKLFRWELIVVSVYVLVFVIVATIWGYVGDHGRISNSLYANFVIVGIGFVGSGFGFLLGCVYGLLRYRRD